MRYSVFIHGQGPHIACFEDVARGMVAALRALGHEVVPPTEKDTRVIIFGANNARDPHNLFPKDAIIYNAEQVSARQVVDVMQALTAYRDSGNVVWDYSEENAKWLRARGVRVVMCPVGYVPEMTTIAPPPGGVEDIDVLFYGSVNPRRRRILDALDAKGLRVVRLFGVYGADRDAVIARSKIVLNLHFYERPVFEIFRVSHLLANRKCVVSEAGGCDAGLEAFAARATHLVPYEGVVDACRALVDNVNARYEVADRGHVAFRSIDLVEGVRRALEESLP